LLGTMGDETITFTLGDDHGDLKRAAFREREWTEIRDLLTREDLLIRGFVEEQLREHTATFMKSQERLLELIIKEQTRSRESFWRVVEQTHGVGASSAGPLPNPTEGTTSESSTDLAANRHRQPTMISEEGTSVECARDMRKSAIEEAYRVTGVGFLSKVRPVHTRLWSGDPLVALTAGFAKGVIDGFAFKIVVSAIILLYMIFVGFEVHNEMSDAMYNFQYKTEDVDKVVQKSVWITVVGYCFIAVFLLELVFRIVALKAQFFLGEGWLWNMFDVLLVLTSAVDQATDFEHFGNWGYLRVFRLFWVLRAWRLAFHSRFVRDFRMMMLAIVSSVVPLFWAVMTLGFLHYLASIVVMTLVSDYVSTAATDDATVDKLTMWFESMPMSMLTLFMAISGGVSWWEIMEPMLVVGHLAGAIIVCFIVVAVLAVLNIITGIFVTDAIEKARSDETCLLKREREQNLEYRRQLENLYRKLDVHRHGQLTFHELCEQAERKEVQAVFSLFGIEATDVPSLFSLLDVDDSLSIECDEFVMGCMKFKSRSTSVNVECSLLEIKDMLRTCMKHIKKHRGLTVATPLGGPIG